MLTSDPNPRTRFPFEHERGARLRDRRSRGVRLTLSAFCASTVLAGPALAQATLRSSDGLALALSGDGTVSSLRLNGTEYASAALPSGFQFRELPAEAVDVAPNGSFETGSSSPNAWSWGKNGSSSWSWQTSVSSSGSKAMQLSMPGGSARRSPALTSDSFVILPNTPYTFSCRIRTAGLSAPLTLYLIERTSNGSVLQRGVSGPTGTADWTSESLTFTSGASAVQAYFKAEVYSGSGTAWLDDVQMADIFGGKTPLLVGGEVAVRSGVVTQTARSEGLELTARFRNAGSAIRVDATLEDTTGHDRAVELSFGLPLAASGWTWEDSFVHSTPVVSGARYETLDTAFGAQAHSTYPFATLRTAGKAVSLAVPPIPQVCRLSYDDHLGFRIVWDFGLSLAATKTPSRASFTFWIYSQAPEWGLRSAAEKYYTLYPHVFGAARKLEGSWLLPADAHSLDSIPNPSDYGWGFLEGLGEIDFANGNGVLSFHYIDPSGWFRGFPGYTAQPPYDTLVNALRTDASSGTGSTVDGAPVREMAQAVVNSSPYDQNGKYQLAWNSYFWYGNRLQIYPVSPDPDIPAPSMWSVVNEYGIDGRSSIAKDSGAHLDGFFLDDITDNFGSVENHRRELWEYSDLPLSFSWASRSVVLFDGFSIAEFCDALRDKLHQSQLTLAGSVNPGAYIWFAAPFDFIGGEVRGAETLDRAYIRRALSYGKGWSNLFVPIGSTAPTAPEVLSYLRQALFLGYFPGFNGRYWKDPSAYERDRLLMRKYMPLIRAAAAEGWRPVPYATASNPAIVLERFDSGTGNRLCLTAQNTGSSPAVFDVVVDGGRLGIQSGPASGRERVSDVALAVTRDAANLRFRAALDPGDTALYELDVPRPANGPSARQTRKLDR